MTNSNAIIDDVISFLRQQKQEGREEVYLPSSVWRELNQDISASAASGSAGAEVSAGQETAEAGAGNEDKSVPEKGEGESEKIAASTLITNERDKEPAAAESAEEEETFEVPADWDSLYAMVEQCIRCGLHRIRAEPLFEKGSRQAELMLIGEAPPSSKIEEMLDKMVAAMQFKPDEVYFANLVKCRTPGGRRPELEERKVCSVYLERQIELVKPKVLLLMGEMTLRFLTGKQSITRWHGQWLDCRGVDAMAIYSPLFMFDHPEAKKEAWTDMQRVMQKCGRK